MAERWRQEGYRPLALVLAAAAGASLGALALLAAIAGWREVRSSIDLERPGWLVLALAAELLSFAGYLFAYRSVAAVEEGPVHDLLHTTKLVAVGFGAFIVKGGAALDSDALVHPDATDDEGEVRVIALDALEHAPLAPAAWISALTLLARGERKPGLDFLLPWATLVPLGAALAFWGVSRRDRFLGRGGWRGKLGQVLAGIRILFVLVREWRLHWLGLAGSTLYWLGDVACLWASLRLFDATPTIPGLVLAHAVAYVLTRRTFPLAGAGILEVLLPLTLVASGAPFAGAIVGVFVYRVFNLWLPLVPALVALPSVRESLARTI